MPSPGGGFVGRQSGAIAGVETTAVVWALALSPPVGVGGVYLENQSFGFISLALVLSKFSTAPAPRHVSSCYRYTGLYLS